MISVEKAKDIILQNTDLLTSTCVLNCEEAIGMVLAEDVIAPIHLPSFDQSAVDGYGISITPGQERKEWRLTEEIKAGDYKNINLGDNECVRIYTGAAVPDSVNCIIMQEFMAPKGSAILVEGHTPKINDNIRRAKSQIEKGEVALKTNTRLNPASVGFLLGLGITQVKVKSVPKVHLIITGSEVQSAGTELVYGKVFDSNSGIIKTALSEMKIPVIKTHFTEDKPEDLGKAIHHALEASDVIIISGGISVGKYDLVKESLENQGVVSLFHKIAQKPGKPMYFGKHQQKMIFALPGNPAAVLTCFYEYLYPAFRKLRGYDKCFLPITKMPLLKDVTKRKELSLYLKAKITETGILPLEGQESNILRSFSEANALIYIPQDVDKVSKGENVEVHILPES